MIHFYHQATFKALTSLLILPHSWTTTTATTGRWRACSFQNYSKKMDSTLLYFAVFAFLQCQLFIHRLRNALKFTWTAKVHKENFKYHPPHLYYPAFFICEQLSLMSVFW